jgi:hypothetical protein
MPLLTPSPPKIWLATSTANVRRWAATTAPADAMSGLGASALTSRQVERRCDGSPHRLGVHAVVKGLLWRAATELGEHLILCPRSGIGGPQIPVHPLPKLRQPHPESIPGMRTSFSRLVRPSEVYPLNGGRTHRKGPFVICRYVRYAPRRLGFLFLCVSVGPSHRVTVSGLHPKGV